MITVESCYNLKNIISQFFLDLLGFNWFYLPPLWKQHHAINNKASFSWDEVNHLKKKITCFCINVSLFNWDEPQYSCGAVSCCLKLLDRVGFELGKLNWILEREENLEGEESPLPLPIREGLLIALMINMNTTFGWFSSQIFSMVDEL